MWYADGKLISAKEVPEDVREELTPPKVEVEEVENQEDKVEKPKHKGCVICGGPHEASRRIMMDQVVWEAPLCGDCYYTRTLGEVHGAIKKRRKKEDEDGRS